MSTDRQWLQIVVKPRWEATAKKIREERDELYGNIFSEEDTDMRWVGDLGEICFNFWLKENRVSGFLWHKDNAAGKPDFMIGNCRIDVKTVKRKVTPRADYTAQITARHKDHPIDELFFMSYEYNLKTLWLLGGISMKRFLEKATYYSAGEKVHDNYSIRKGHEIYNAPLTALDGPVEWLEKLKIS